jgi:hypothetical protein
VTSSRPSPIRKLIERNAFVRASSARDAGGQGGGGWHGRGILMRRRVAVSKRLKATHKRMNNLEQTVRTNG